MTKLARYVISGVAGVGMTWLARLVATVRTSAASTPLVMKQRDEDAADAVSSRQHVHGEDAEHHMAAAHLFDNDRQPAELAAVHCPYEF